MNNFIFHCFLKPPLSIRWKKQNTKWPICFSLSHQLVSLLKFNTCRRKLCKIVRSNQTAVSSPLRQWMVFPVQMSQDVVDAAFGCLRLSREHKTKIFENKMLLHLDLLQCIYSGGESLKRRKVEIVFWEMSSRCCWCCKPLSVGSHVSQIAIFFHVPLSLPAPSITPKKIQIPMEPWLQSSIRFYIVQRTLR